MSYLIVLAYPIIFLFALFIAIRIDQKYKEKRRKRIMKSMYDFWDENTNPLD